jgi:hypothetical protein
MPKGPVQFQGSFLQLHPRLEAVRRLRPPPHEAVDLFLDIDEGFFHGTASISRNCGEGKIRRW